MFPSNPNILWFYTSWFRATINLICKHKGLLAEIQCSRKWVSKYCSSCGDKPFFPGTVNSIIKQLSSKAQLGTWTKRWTSNPQGRTDLWVVVVRVWWLENGSPVVKFPAGSLRLYSLELAIFPASSDALVKMKPVVKMKAVSLKMCN